MANLTPYVIIKARHGLSGDYAFKEHTDKKCSRAHENSPAVVISDD